MLPYRTQQELGLWKKHHLLVFEPETAIGNQNI